MIYKINMSTKTFTTTIESDLLIWLNFCAEKAKTTKRNILEKALREFQVREKKKSIAEGFKRASKDEAVICLSEFGFEDLNEQLKNLES